ncbi:MAG: glycosyltransferase [Bdellovibrionales bacterium]|nr:glycosyltransferase [Bdellovibrionales bacterium]
MNILILPKYGQMAATTRYRFSQYLPFLEREGVSFCVSPLLSDAYLAGRFQNGRTPLAEVTRCYLSRIWLLLKVLLTSTVSARGPVKYDLLIIHCELFPFLPPFFEFALSLLKVPYIYDFDDAIFHQYDQHPRHLVRRIFANKISYIISKAKMVFAGSPYLAEYAKRFNPAVEDMPTVVSIKAYQTRSWPEPLETWATVMPTTTTTLPSRPSFVIGWIGTPSTTPYLSEVAEALRIFCRKYPERGQIQIKLVGASSSLLPPMPGVPIEVIPWTESSETTIIQSFDVGIMPLPDEPWARGKCAFKLLQYMACGIPVIASPVGMNKNVVLNTEMAHRTSAADAPTVLLASSPTEWVAAFEDFYQHPSRAIAMGRQGRLCVEENYSVEIQGPRWVKCAAKACVR